MESQTSNQTAPKSAFITILAWIMIVLSGMAFMGSIAQNIMIYTIFPLEDFQASMRAEDFPAGFPIFIFQNLQLFFGLIGGLFALTLAGSIGLLMRKNWARILISILLAVGILYIVGGIFFQFTFIQGIQAEIPDPEFQTILNAISIISILFAVGIAGLHSWLIVKLNSKGIVQEFGR